MHWCSHVWISLSIVVTCSLVSLMCSLSDSNAHTLRMGAHETAEGNTVMLCASMNATKGAKLTRLLRWELSSTRRIRRCNQGAAAEAIKSACTYIVFNFIVHWPSIFSKFELWPSKFELWPSIFSKFELCFNLQVIYVEEPKGKGYQDYMCKLLQCICAFSL